MTLSRHKTKGVSLPPAQHAALVALIDFKATHSYSPTYTELARALGLRETSARSSIFYLAKKGLVEVTPKISRSMTVTPAGAMAARTKPKLPTRNDQQEQAAA